MDYLFLSNTPLFHGLTETDTDKLMELIPHNERNYRRGQMIKHTGDIVRDIGLILSGSAQIESIDLLGNRSILSISTAGDVFAEAYACIPDQPMLVDVVAQEKCRVLFINVSGLFTATESDHNAAILIRNLLSISSRKNVQLSRRIFHSAPKTIRQRLFSYFSDIAAMQGTVEISIPLNRQQLADYLGVERTALSKELGKMRNEGLLEFKKNRFNLRFAQTDNVLN